MLRWLQMLTHKTITLEMSLLSTVADVKARIYSKEGETCWASEQANASVAVVVAGRRGL